MYYSAKYDSPVGELNIVSDGENIIGLYMQGQKYYGGVIRGEVTEDLSRPEFKAAEQWLGRYFGGKNPSIAELKIRTIGSEFRRTVWDILCLIPYGKTVTYGDIAQQAATILKTEKMSAQAVGGAVGHNPISIIIPCHRVVGKDGSLTGYAGGINNKIKLLELEGADMSKLFIPKKGTAL